MVKLTMRLKVFRIAGWALIGRLSLPAAQLSGIVVDASGFTIPHATIKIACAGANRSGGTDGQGRFHFPTLPEGSCRIHIVHAGFAAFEEELTGRDTVLRVQLAVETHRDSIRVTADGEDAPSPAPEIGTVSIDDAELRKISNDPRVWVSYAKLLAGVADAPAQLYVDGLPASQLPPAALIARIIVNPDTFSAEYSNGNYTHIEIITRAPARQFRFNVGTDSLGFGGRDVLAPGPNAISHSINGSLSGAIPHLPLAVSLVASVSESVDPVAVTAILSGIGFPSLDSDRSGTFGSRSLSLSPDVYYYPAKELQLHFSYSESLSVGRNMGVGGLTLMDAGTDTSFGNREGRFTFHGVRKALAYRGGFVIVRSEAGNSARNTEPGLNVLGDFSTGGPALLKSDSTHLAWSWKSVIEPASGQSWSAGFTVAGTDDTRHDAPNPGGVYTFTDLDSYAQFLTGSSTAIWTGFQGNGSLHFGQLNVSPFLQKRLFKSSHVSVNAGVRADAQSSAGVFVSPRLSAAVGWHGFVIRGGAGMFVHNIPGNVFIRAIQGDGTHLTPILIDGAGMDAASQPTLESAPLVLTSLSPSLALPRELIGKITLNRALGRFTPGIEYTDTRDWKLLGSQRFAGEDGWMDVIASNRSHVAQRIQSQLSYAWKAERLTLSHEWIHSYDNTDGPFSFPEQQNNLAAEWARSSGVPRQNVTLAGSFKLIRSVYLTLTDSWHGSAPYNITEAADPEGDGLFNDRGGRPRNSGNGPAFNSLSAYTSRRFAVPEKFAHAIHGMTVGLRCDNLLGNRNYLSVGSVAGSPAFGQPMVAAMGRSVRLWFTFD